MLKAPPANPRVYTQTLTMEIFLNFNKGFISEKVINFLDQNILDESIKKSLARIFKGNKLQYMEANVLIDLLLKALIIEDGEEEIPITIKRAVKRFWMRHSGAGGWCMQAVKRLHVPVKTLSMCTYYRPRINIPQNLPWKCH